MTEPSNAPPTTPAEAVRAAADHLRACIDCGKVHKPHPDLGGFQSWRDPVDRHYYRPRIQDNQVTRLLHEFAATLEP